MNLDFEKALTYISKDPQWGNKLLAGGGLVLSTFAVFVFPLLSLLTGSFWAVMLTFVPAFIFSVLIWLAVSGYICETAYKRINNPYDNILPDWSGFASLILTGFKYFVGYFLYFLPLTLTGIVFASVFMFGVSNFKEGLSSLNVVAFLFIVFLGALLLFLYILTLVFLPLMMTNFFKDKKILSFVDIKDALSLVKENAFNYFILILLFVAVTMLCYIIFSFLAATIIGLIFLPVVYMYVYYVCAELCAQFALSKKYDTNKDN